MLEVTRWYWGHWLFVALLKNTYIHLFNMFTLLMTNRQSLRESRLFLVILFCLCFMYATWFICFVYSEYSAVSLWYLLCVLSSRFVLLKHFTSIQKAHVKVSLHCMLPHEQTLLTLELYSELLSVICVCAQAKWRFNRWDVVYFLQAVTQH